MSLVTRSGQKASLHWRVGENEPIATLTVEPTIGRTDDMSDLSYVFECRPVSKGVTTAWRREASVTLPNGREIQGPEDPLPDGRRLCQSLKVAVDYLRVTDD